MKAKKKASKKAKPQQVLNLNMKDLNVAIKSIYYAILSNTELTRNEKALLNRVYIKLSKQAPK